MVKELSHALFLYADGEWEYWRERFSVIYYPFVVAFIPLKETKVTDIAIKWI